MGHVQPETDEASEELTDLGKDILRRSEQLTQVRRNRIQDLTIERKKRF